MLARMLGAARLDVGTFEEVENDRSATLQALIVVVIVAIASGVGGVLSGDGDVVRGLGFGVVRGVLFWALWALGTWLIGSTILRTSETQANWGQLARGTGFAQTPGILNVFFFIPGFGFASFVVIVWQLAAMMIAVRQSLDYSSTWRAFFVVLLALIPVGILYGIAISILGVGVPIESQDAADAAGALLVQAAGWV